MRNLDFDTMEYMSNIFGQFEPQSNACKEGLFLDILNRYSYNIGIDSSDSALFLEIFLVSEQQYPEITYNSEFLYRKILKDRQKLKVSSFMQ